MGTSASELSLKLAQGRSPAQLPAQWPMAGNCIWKAGPASLSVYRAREQIQEPKKKHTEKPSLLFGLSPTPLGAVTQE